MDPSEIINKSGGKTISCFSNSLSVFFILEYSEEQLENMRSIDRIIARFIEGEFLILQVSFGEINVEYYDAALLVMR